MLARRGAVLGLALSLAAALAPGAWAGEPGAELFASIDRVLRLLADQDLKEPGRGPERLEAIRRSADGIFDFEEMTRQSLERHWDARTPAERSEFVQLFYHLLERSFLSRLALYNGEKVVVVGETVDGDEATVQTHVVTPEGERIPVDYRMLRRADGWRACDIVFGGVSLVQNYRVQFDRIIQRASFQQLVKQVRQRQ